MKTFTEGDLITTLQRFVARGQEAQHAAEQIAYHGPGPTFGELAIGECFEWPPPIPRAHSGEPLVKASAVRYEWSRGSGTAEAFYRVERWTGKDLATSASSCSTQSGPTSMRNGRIRGNGCRPRCEGL